MIVCAGIENIKIMTKVAKGELTVSEGMEEMAHHFAGPQFFKSALALGRHQKIRSAGAQIFRLSTPDDTDFHAVFLSKTVNFEKYAGSERGTLPLDFHA